MLGIINMGRISCYCFCLFCFEAEQGEREREQCRWGQIEGRGIILGYLMRLSKGRGKAKHKRLCTRSSGAEIMF